ncbi:MAG: TetR/AcrR family transcriptional regulator [Nitrospinae bacterium]|nr:TetR/AcrR family transcriptional regulator [Nitrospinota bacterium]
MAPRMNVEHMEARKRQIVDAACTCFSRNGFHKTTMQDICARAGMSPGAVYRYFPGKQAIIAAMPERERVENLAIIKNVSENSDGGAYGALTNLADIFFEKLSSMPKQDVRLEVELWAEALRNPAILKACKSNTDSHINAFAKIIRQAQNSGELSPGVDAKTLSIALINLYVGLLQLMSMGARVDMKEYLKQIKAMVGSFFNQAEAR